MARIDLMPGSFSPWLRVFVPYAAAYFFSYLLRNVNAVIAPLLAGDFGLQPGDLGLLTSAYLVGFALMQLPVGLALDRYGPRRVAAGLLLVASGSCLLFALAGNLVQLFFARGLIGIGVSACLMSGFKAFATAFPTRQRASVNAAIMAAGGLGALTATVPLNALLAVASWQQVFAFLALLGTGLAWLVFRTGDEQPGAVASGSPRELLGELYDILTSRSFRHFAPISSFIVGGFIAIQGLWAAYWLSGAQGLTPAAVSHALMMLTVGLIVGYSLIAALLLSPRHSISLNAILGWGGALILACQLSIVGELIGGSAIWFSYGVFSALMNVAYTSHAACYPLHLQGRANTCLNLAIFISGFLIQWGMGGAIEFGLRAGRSVAFSFKVVWLSLIALQFGGLAWFVAGAGWRRRQASPAP